MRKVFYYLITILFLFETQSKIHKSTKAKGFENKESQIFKVDRIVNRKEKQNNITLECQTYMSQIHDIFKPKPLYELLGHIGSVNSAVELDNGLLATGSGDYSIKIWYLRDNAANLIKTIIPGNIIITLTSLNRGLLAAGLSNGSIFVYNTTDFSLFKNFSAHGNRVTRFLEYNEEIFFTASSDKFIRGWNASNDFTNITEFYIDNGFGIVSFIKMNYDFNKFAVGNQNGTICILDFNDNNFSVIKSFEFYAWKPVSDLIEFEEFGILLASSYSGKIGLFDIRNDFLLIDEIDLKNPIYSMTKLDNYFIACGLKDNSTVLLQLNDQGELNVVRKINENADAVLTIYKLSSGLVLVLSEDKTARIWAFQELNCINYIDNKNKYYFYDMDFFPSLMTNITRNEQKDFCTESFPANCNTRINIRTIYPSKTIFSLSNEGEYSYFQENLTNYPLFRISDRYITSKIFIEYNDEIYIVLGLIDGTISFNFVKDYDKIVHYFYLPKIHKSLIHDINLFDDNKIISCSEDGILIIWNIEDTSVPLILYDNKGEEIYQCFGVHDNLNNKRIIITGFSYIKVFEMENDKLKILKILNDKIPKTPLYKATMLKDNNLLIMSEEKIIIYDTNYNMNKEISFNEKKISAIKILKYRGRKYENSFVIGFEDGDIFFFNDILKDNQPSYIVKAKNKSVVDFFEYIDGLLLITYSDFSLSTINYFYFS